MIIHIRITCGSAFVYDDIVVDKAEQCVPRYCRGTAVMRSVIMSSSSLSTTRIYSSSLLVDIRCDFFLSHALRRARLCSYARRPCLKTWPRPANVGYALFRGCRFYGSGFFCPTRGDFDGCRISRRRLFCHVHFVAWRY